MNRVKLRFHAISQIVGSIGVGIIVLTDEAKERQISVVCDADMTDALCKRLQKKDDEDVHLAGALSSFLKQNETQVEVFIYGIQDGQYCAMLLDADSLVSVKLKVCDAILFALSGHCQFILMSSSCEHNRLLLIRNRKIVWLCLSMCSIRIC